MKKLRILKVLLILYFQSGKEVEASVLKRVHELATRILEQVPDWRSVIGDRHDLYEQYEAQSCEHPFVIGTNGYYSAFGAAVLGYAAAEPYSIYKSSQSIGKFLCWLHDVDESEMELSRSKDNFSVLVENARLPFSGDIGDLLASAENGELDL